MPQAPTFTSICSLTVPYSSFSRKAQGQMPPPGPVLMFPIKANRDQEQYHSWHHCPAHFALHKDKASKNEENYCRVGLNHTYRILFRQLDPIISLLPAQETAI